MVGGCRALAGGSALCPVLGEDRYPSPQGLMCESGKTLHCIIMAFFSLLGINPIGISAYL